MRSEIAKKIMEETPKETKDFVANLYNEVITKRNAEIEAIILTPEEIKIVCDRAIWQEKCKIYRLSRREDDSMKAKNEGLNIYGKKVEK